MRELQEALVRVGLSWRDVWVLTVDRRAGTLVVVAADGRKFRAKLGRAEGGNGGEWTVDSGSVSSGGERPSAVGRPRPNDRVTP